MTERRIINDLYNIFDGVTQLSTKCALFIDTKKQIVWA